MPQRLEHLLLQVGASCGPHLASLHQFIQQPLKPLQRTMQAGPAQGRGQVIHNHGVATAFGLRSLPRVIDDEGVEMRNGPERQLRRTASAQSNGFARQPFGAAMFAHVQHQVRPMPLPQPQVLREITMGWWQIR